MNNYLREKRIKMVRALPEGPKKRRLMRTFRFTAADLAEPKEVVIEEVIEEPVQEVVEEKPKKKTRTKKSRKVSDR